MMAAVWNKGPLLMAHKGLRCVNARVGDDGIHTHRLTILIHETCEIAMCDCQGGKREPSYPLN